MRWYGKIFGAIAVCLLMRGHPVGLLIGALIGHAFDAGWIDTRSTRARTEAAYRELGVSPDASDEEIDRAYRKLMAQYHPDRVGTAAPEIKAVAEERSRAINAAYDRVRRARRKQPKKD